MMPTKQQITGMQGVYLVAAELSGQELSLYQLTSSQMRLRLIVLVTDQKYKRAFSVQVKTKSENCWIFG